MKDNNFNSFIMYHDFYDSLEELTNEEAGLLFKAIYNYQMGNEYLTDDKLVNIMIKTLIKTFERDKDKWLLIKEKRSEAAKTRWSNEKQIKPKPKIVKETKPKTSKEPKTAYGEFGKVTLTEKQYIQSLEVYGNDVNILNEAINILDNYIESTGKVYKNHYAVLNGWVKERMNEIYKSKNKTNLRDINIELDEEFLKEF